MVLDQLAQRWQWTFKEERRFQGWCAQGTLGSTKVTVLKPQTYMNRSGQAARAALDWLKIPPTQLLVIYDEMALPVGRLRIRKEGSAGGHNGMKSLIEHLGTQQFPRLRLGIDQPPPPQDAAGYVLGRFSPIQRKVLPLVLDAACAAVETLISQGVETAMNEYNPWTP